MIATAREALRKRLPPNAFDRVWLYWWVGRHYVPRLCGSLFAPRRVRVRVFPGSDASPLAELLGDINMAAPTKMCRVMTKYGSDKGRQWHNYTIVYSALFREFRHRPLRMFEMGLGTNRPDFAFNMGVNGRPGASLRGWRELFPKALVYGADIDRDSLFEEERIQTFFCDQLDPAAIHDLWSQPALAGGVDVIIDDGLHTFEGNTSFLNASLNHLRPGGVYVVEDIHREAIGKWLESLEAFSKRFPNYEFALAELPNPSNPFDNNLLIVRRRVG
jgi:hypothetical protein